MGKVRTISRGIPVSTETLGDHASAINDLYDDIAGHTTGVLIQRPEAQLVSKRVMDAQFWAEQTGGKVTALTAYNWSVTFNPAFADIPVVTTGLVIGTGSPTMAARGIVSISSISANGASGTVVFPEDGNNIKVYVSVHAIGQSKS